MGLSDVTERLRESYSSLSEKIPHFNYLVAAVCVFILSLGAFFIFSSPQLTTLTIDVENPAGVGVKDANVFVSTQSGELFYITNSEGTALIEGVLIGDEVEVVITKNGYSELRETVRVAQDMRISLTLTPSTGGQAGFLEIFFTFVGPDSKKITDKQVNVNLSCLGSGKFEKSEYVVTNGELKVNPPQNCGKVVVNADSAGFKNAKATVLGKEQVILFEGLERPKGSVQIKVRDEQTQKFVDGIGIRLLDAQGLESEFFDTTSFGEVNFANVSAGDYRVVVSDITLEYATSNALISVAEKSTTRKEIAISKDVKLNARAKVKSKGGGALAGSLVVLTDSLGGIVESKLSNASGEAVFAIKESGTYSMQASKEAYLPSSKVSINTFSSAKGSTVDFPFELEACTPQKCGTLVVRVLDENSSPVENATVVLLDETGFVQTAYGGKSTDFNGFALPFTALAAGKYRALAQKFPAEAQSQLFEIDVTKQNFAQVNVTIGTGTVNVVAIDSDGNPLEFAQADVYSQSGQKIGTISLDSQGTGSLSVKADRKVYAIVKKNGFAKYFTASKQVYPSKTITLRAVLPQEISGDMATAQFDGIYSQSGAQATQLQNGQVYTARFLLGIPTGAEFSQAGMFVRAGKRTNVSEEVFTIESVSAPFATVTKGATYNPPLSEQDEELTNSSAKWAQLDLTESEGGTYEIEVEFKVKKGVIKGTQLAINYRAFSVSGNDYLRDPYDNELLNAAESAQKQGLYAKTHEKIFAEGAQQLCAETICFSSRVLDENAGLYIIEPYVLKTFTPYTLEFSLTNNSDTIFDGAGIEIRNTNDAQSVADDLSINSYTIENASAQVFPSQTPTFQTTRLAAGDFTRNKSFSGTAVIESKQAGSTGLEFRLFANSSVAHSNILQFLATSNEDMNLTVSPGQIASLIPSEITIKATHNSGERKGFGIEGARVIAKRVSPDRSESTILTLTTFEGVAKIQVPSSAPGTRIVITVEKEGFGKAVKEVMVSSGIVSFEPSKIGVSLNRATKEQANTDVLVLNGSGRQLAVKKLVISGNLRGLLDQDRMTNYLKQFVGNKISSDGQGAIAFLSAIGSAAQSLDGHAKVSGTLIGEFALSDDPSKSWIATLPFEATINLAQLPENSPCIYISKKEWNDATIGSLATLDFEIQNNCRSEDGTPITLQNLEAQVEWSGNDGITGQVELSVTDTTSGEISSEILQQGIWSRFTDRFEYGKVYPARIRFVPKQDSLGKNAEFSVKIDGALVTNTGAQYVGTNNEIEAKIVIANLDQCIEVTPNPQEGITIGHGEDETEFTVDTTKCGPVSIDVRICGEPGNEFCRGGTTEGGVTITPSSGFSAIKQEVRTVKVKRQEIPGLYGVTVEARPFGGSWRRVADMEATVEPEEGEYFTMDKYAFTVIGKGSKDSAALTNRMLQESVQVRANLCDWKDASSGLHFNGQGAMMGMAGGIIVGYLAAQAAAIGALAASGIGALVAVVIIIVMAIFDDPCEKYKTNALQDYVINLAGTLDSNEERYIPPDALDIVMSNKKIKGSWNTQITDVIQRTNRSTPNGRQVVGTVFENITSDALSPSGSGPPEPVIYSIATMRAKEHIHGDNTHEGASVNCDSSDFGVFWINPKTCPPSTDTQYSQKFHLRFKVSEPVASIPKIDFDTQACQSGIDIGRTGLGAVPRIKFNWSWDETKGGIGANSCDAQNPNYIYCDATQFSIELNKKLYYLHDFLKANNFDLGCPQLREERTQSDEEMSKSASAIVGAGQMGLKTLSAKSENGKINVILTAKNATPFDQNITALTTIGFGADVLESCTMEIIGIAPGAEKQSACSFDASTEGTYAIYSSISGSSAPSLATESTLTLGFTIWPANSKAACEIKSTETMGGMPQITRFIRDNEKIVWTENVPNEDALQKLLIFDAYLMKDNYSKEFFADFADHYTNSSFEDTDFYFTRLEQDSEGNNYGFNRIMEKGKFVLTRKYENNSQLPSAGKYGVELAAYFPSNSWNLFTSSGELDGSVAIVVYKKDDPYPNSPFYSMPFDGLVGLEGDKYSRANYGVAYNVEGEGMGINGSQQQVRTFADNASNPVVRANVKISEDLYSMNASAATRGMLLQFTYNGKVADIVFQPSHATPVIMKVSQSAPTSEKFSSYYGMRDSSEAVNIGNTLGYWDGAGTCNDFSGTRVTESFYQKPDRHALQSDRLLDYSNVYALDWQKAVKSGDVYLRTIFYTPSQRDISLRAIEGLQGSAKPQFYTPDTQGSQVALNGISGMAYNSFAAGGAGTINTLEDLFAMVENGKACVTNTGSSTKIWWNPQVVYSTQGTERNISAQTNSLEAGVSCIG